MKEYYNVTFEYSHNVYCANIAHASSVEAVREEYKKYNWVSIKKASVFAVEDARRKGMPIVEI